MIDMHSKGITVKNIAKLTFLLIISLLVSCKSDNADLKGLTFIEKYGGQPYKGTVTSTSKVGNTTTPPASGTSTFQLMDIKGDSVTLVVTGKFGTNNEINLKIKGRQDGLNWRSAENEIRLEILGGSIRGETINQQERFLSSGNISETDFNLDFQITLLQAFEEFPAGTEINLLYRTKRDSGNAGGNNGEGCEIVLRPIWSPNGIVMGMVPEC